MNLFRKVENNIGVVKSKKENQIKIVKTLEKIVEKIFSYFNDNKFIFEVKEVDAHIKYDYSFLSSCSYNKELLKTLFNFDEIDISENVPYINGVNFYDNLLLENDSYAENIENFLNADKKWLKKINKDFCYIFHGAELIKEVPEIKKFFDDFIKSIQSLMNNETSEFEFLVQSNELLVNLIQFLEQGENNFKTQVNFFQNKYFIHFLFFISFMERTSTFEKNTEEEDSDLRKNIDDLVKQIFENINKVLMVIVKDNPLTASLLFSRIAISLLIRNDFNELGFYRNILKMMQRFNCKINYLNNK